MKPKTPSPMIPREFSSYATGQEFFGGLDRNSTNDFREERAGGANTIAQESLFSVDTIKVMDQIRALDIDNSASHISRFFRAKPPKLEEKLFDAKAQVKILFSQVSMHFSKDLRTKLFDQLDLLHEIEGWEEGDDAVKTESFSTFLRWLYLYRPDNFPSLGLSFSGHLIASWLANDNKDILTLEFLHRDTIKWYVTKYFDKEPEQGNGTASLRRIGNTLSPYHTEDWFSGRS